MEIVTSDIAVGADIDPTNRTAWYMRLGDRGCVFSAAQVVESAAGNRVLCRNVYDHRGSYREGIDLIVNWHGCRTDESLAAAITNGIEVHAIGDCVSPRNLEIAIAEAEALSSKL